MADEDHPAILNEPASQQPEPVPQPEAPLTAAERLYAFEVEHFGQDCVRIDGLVERGSGSPWQKMSDEEKAQYAALERLVAAEQRVGDARAALVVAEMECAEAEIAVANA